MSPQQFIRTGKPVVSSASVVRSIPVNLCAGLTIGVLVVFMEISLAALIFAGELSGYFGAGLGILLLGALISGIIATCYSGLNISVSIPQDVPAAILAVMAATIVSESSQPASFETFATVVMVMAVSTILTGALLWLFGHYNLGRLVRFLPYPVIGGFMAGTGWLLFVGGIGVLNNGGLSLQLLTAESLVQWVPALVFAIALLVATRRFTNPLILPAIVVFALIAFYLLLAFFNGGLAAGLDAALEKGWLLGPLPEGDLWRPVTFDAIQGADWSLVIGNSVGMITIFLITTVSLLLNASGLEIITRTDIDLNRELKCIGCANMASGVAGSSASYQMLSLSTLLYRLGANSRLAGLTVAVVVGVTLLLGADILSGMPKLVAAGFLIFLGISFLTEWLYDGWFKLPASDYLLVWLILGTIATVGLLAGVIVGVLVAVVLFVVAYTSTDVVRRTFSRDKYQSFIMRSPELEKLLEQRGDGFYVMELQGYIFFGTAHQLLDKVKSRIDDKSQPSIRYLLLDFRLVTGFDSSASYSFSRLSQITTQADIIVGFSNVDPEMSKYLSGDPDTQSSAGLVFEDLDHGVAWFDNKEIEAEKERGVQLDPIPLLHYFQTALSHSGSPREIDQRLKVFMDFLTVESGTVLLHEGDRVNYIYFIESGEVSVQTELDDGVIKKLRVQSAGTVFGEIGIYGKAMATATVVVSETAQLYSMSAEGLRQMDAEDPGLAVAVHRLIATTLGRKLTQASNARRH